MKFKNTGLLVCMVIACLGSTAAHADIPGKQGLHRVEIINNIYAKSIRIRAHDIENGIVGKSLCFNVKYGQVLKTSYVIKNGNWLEYSKFNQPYCTGTRSNDRANIVLHNNDEYWLAWW